MSTASSIDLLVDLKEIQSRSPRVAFPCCGRLKDYILCLSVLIVIITPSSCGVCAIFSLPWFLLTPSLQHVNTFPGSFLPTSLCCSLSDVSRAVDSSHADNYQPEKNVTGARICGNGSSATSLNNNNSIWGVQNYSRTLQNPLSSERSVYISFCNSEFEVWPLLSCPSLFLLLFVYS